MFLNTFGKSLWSPGRGPEQMPDSELVRTGRIAFLRPGEQVPFTVAWHAKDGDARGGRLRGGVAAGAGLIHRRLTWTLVV